MDLQKYGQARQTVLNRTQVQNGIGTLGEKTLHAVLKEYYKTNALAQEYKIGRYVADLAGENQIIEIQTRQFYKMTKKLLFFLQDYDVTIIYPVPHHRWVCWMDAEGNLSKKRKSPKVGAPYDILSELAGIKPLLFHPRLHFCIVLLDTEDCRLLNGWSLDKKRGSTRYERIPLTLIEEVELHKKEDFHRLLPPNLPTSFTSADFSHIAKRPLRFAQQALNVLYEAGAVIRTGREGRAYQYQIPR